MKPLDLLVFGAISFAVSLGSAGAADTEIQQFYSQTQAQLVAKNFDALEAQSGELRSDDKRFAGGLSGVLLFYRALSGQSLANNHWRDPSRFNDKDAAFDKQRELLEAWRAAKPGSIAPQIALALLWRGYAWQARGSTFSDKVPSEQWPIFEERIAKQDEALHKAIPADAATRNAVSIDAGAYFVLLSLARDQSWTRNELDSLYREAIGKHPTSFHLYIQRAETLEPRWFGVEGELNEYADSLLQDPGGDVGRMAYSFMAIRKFDRRYPMREFYERTGLRWADVKAGFEVREKRYGLSNVDWNLLLYFACAALDRPTGRRAAEHIGDDWASWLWGEKRVFDNDVAWTRR
jgi:hypothetical protein